MQMSVEELFVQIERGSIPDTIRVLKKVLKKVKKKMKMKLS